MASARSPVVLMIALAMALSACGSTVQPQLTADGTASAAPDPPIGMSTADSPAQLGSPQAPGPAAPATGSGAAPGGGGAGGGGAGGGGAGGGGAGGGGGTVAAPAGSTGQQPPPPGPDATATNGPSPDAGDPAGAQAATTITDPVTLGFLITAVGNADSFGLNIGQTYSPREIYDALITAINSIGGLADRPIDPVFATVDTGSHSWASDYQAACATFTEDHQAVAVLGYSFAFFESFEACLSNAGVVHVNAGYEAGDAQAASDYPSLFNANPTTDRRFRLQVEGPMRAGRLSPDNRIGLIIGSCPIYQRGFANGAQPIIDANGLQLVAVTEIGCPAGAADAGVAASQISSAVLRFRSEGVDTVLTEGVPVILFATSAESQEYHPQYFLTSTSGGAALEPNVPPRQLANMYGYGWFPGVDVNRVNQPPPTGAQQRCLDLLASQDVIPVEFNDFVNAYTSCDALFLYESALQVTAGVTDAATVGAAIESLGTSHAGVVALDAATAFGAGRHDAPARYQEWSYDQGCSCFRYGGSSLEF